MTQLPLFPEAEGASQSVKGEGGRYPPLANSLTVACGPADAPWEALPAGVLDFPTPPVGDPVWERFGLIVVDAPRGVAKGLRVRHRWAGGWSG